MTTYRCAACAKEVEVEMLPVLVDEAEVTPCEICVGAAEEAVKEESYDEGYQEGWQAGYDTATEEWEEKGVSTGRAYPLMSNINEVEKGEQT